MSDKDDIKKLKRWLKANDPEEKAKRQAYAQSTKAKELRRKGSRKRRHASSALLGLLKRGELVSSDGKRYALVGGRVVEKFDGRQFVIRSTKNGTIHRLEFDEDDDLEDEKYDIELKEKREGLKEMAEKLLIEKDAALEKTVSKINKLQVEEIPPERRYWTNLSYEEASALIDKIQSHE